MKALLIKMIAKGGISCHFWSPQHVIIYLETLRRVSNKTIISFQYPLYFILPPIAYNSQAQKGTCNLSYSHSSNFFY